jgi:hypothetical protein
VTEPTRSRNVVALIIAAVVVALLSIGLTAWLLRDDGDDVVATATTTTEADETSTTDSSPPTTAPSELDGLHVAVSDDVTFELGEGGAVHTSIDGVEWTTFDVADGLRGVAATEELLVAVGARTGADGASTGVIMTSTDGATWEESATTPTPLDDVVFGPTGWLAVGTPMDGASADGVVYRSDDATTWEQVATIPSESSDYERLTISTVAAGPEGYIIGGSWCLGDSCGAELFVSSDATEWSRVQGLELAGAVTAYGDRWGLIGARGNDLSGYSPLSATSEDGSTWTIGTFEPSDLTLNSLAAAGTGAGTGWIGVDQAVLRGEPAAGIWTSEDLTSWTRASEITGNVTDVIVVGGAS